MTTAQSDSGNARQARPARVANNCASRARLGAGAAVLVLALLARPAPAAPINYGSHMGTHVTYVNVTEDSLTSDSPPLFGAPTVTGNSMDFNPIGFDAETTGAAGSDDTDANLDFMVAAKSGSRISRLTFGEAGDTTLGGNVAPGSMGTGSAVAAGGTLLIQEVDFAPITPISVPFALAFTPSGGTFFLGTDGGGLPLYHAQWTGSATLNVDAILIANGFALTPGLMDPDSGATKVSIDLDDTLDADTEAGTSALIGKTDFGVTTLRSNAPFEPGGDPEIPEPSSLALLAGIGLAGLLLRRRATLPTRQT
jgi:hypothetical protein